jgi:hypothetical protein
MVSKGDKTIEPFPATAEREPSAILILEFPAHGLYEENKLDSPVIWSVAPESMIHVRLGMILRWADFGKLPFWAMEHEGV